ncbi:hypothetical protein Ahy_Scaffold6g108080 [Arachis hypogaea]|uniref:Ubiquitin-like protease family profile domain-containing protein n=1 Tax=Arachis hypogaea TaxID=3818 RepID=A0A444WPA1_ARAHY|nr:hypothetical protein Ahy_Scaffold6g108080 [Arachis hypogaea]
MAHSSTSPSHSKKIQPFHFQATLQTVEIAIVAKIRTLYQHNIELLIKNTQETMAGRNQAGKNQTKDLKRATHLLSEKFRNMSEEKKTIVRDLGFGVLMHIPPLRVHHQILRKLANSFKLGKNKLKTGYGSFKIRPKIIGAALGINASGDLFPQKVNYKDLSKDDKQIFRRFQGKMLKNMTNEMMAIAVDNEQGRLMFKRIFILYIHMEFLLPTTINKISPVHLAPIFKMDTITERNWGGYVLNFIFKGITDYKASSTSSSETEKTESDHSTSESETEEDSEDSTRKQGAPKSKKSEESSPVEKQKTKKKTQRTPKKIQSKKKKVIVQDSSPEQTQSYHGSEIGTQELDEFLRKNNEKSAAHGEKQADLRSTEGHYVSYETLSLFEVSASEPAEENVMVMREETPSKVLAIVPIQVCLPLSQTTTTPETENEPTPLLQIEGTTKSTPEPPQLEETTPTVLSAPSKINPAPEDDVVLMMMARTALYVPKADPLPSFSLGLTDSSQEEAATQEGESTQEGGMQKIPETPKFLEQLGDLMEKIANSGVKAENKSPQIQKETGGESFGKFKTPVRINQNMAEMKEKCYIWGTRLKKYADGRTNEFDNLCTLIVQDKYILTRMHLASFKEESHIEAEIVSAMCLILNQKNDKRFQEEVYCLLLILCISFVVSQLLQNMAIAKHPKGMRVYAGGAPLKKKEKEKEIRAPYINISGQKTSYDCAIYVMKWLELIELENIKRAKYEWDN